MGEVKESVATDYQFLISAIDQLNELNNIITATSKDLKTNLKKVQNNDEEKTVKKIYTRLEITCKLGLDTIQNTLTSLNSDYIKWTKKKKNYDTSVEQNGIIENVVQLTEIENIKDINGEILDDIMCSDQLNAVEENESEDNQVKLKLVAIEKLMDPKLLKKTESDNNVCRRSSRKSNKIMDISTILIDDSDETDSDLDLIIPATVVKAKQQPPKVLKKTDKEITKDLLAKCKELRIKVKKLPQRLEKLMKKHGITEIRNQSNIIIALTEGSSNSSKRKVSFKTNEQKTNDCKTKRKTRKRLISSSSNSDTEMEQIVTTSLSKPSKSRRIISSSDTSDNESEKNEENSKDNNEVFNKCSDESSSTKKNDELPSSDKNSKTTSVSKDDTRKSLDEAEDFNKENEHEKRNSISDKEPSDKSPNDISNKENDTNKSDKIDIPDKNIDSEKNVRDQDDIVNDVVDQNDETATATRSKQKKNSSDSIGGAGKNTETDDKTKNEKAKAKLLDGLNNSEDEEFDKVTDREKEKSGESNAEESEKETDETVEKSNRKHKKSKKKKKGDKLSKKEQQSSENDNLIDTEKEKDNSNDSDDENNVNLLTNLKSLDKCSRNDSTKNDSDVSKADSIKRDKKVKKSKNTSKEETLLGIAQNIDNIDNSNEISHEMNVDIADNENESENLNDAAKKTLLQSSTDEESDNEGDNQKSENENSSNDSDPKAQRGKSARKSKRQEALKKNSRTSSVEENNSKSKRSERIVKRAGDKPTTSKTKTSDDSSDDAKSNSKVATNSKKNRKGKPSSDSKSSDESDVFQPKTKKRKTNTSNSENSTKSEEDEKDSEKSETDDDSDDEEEKEKKIRKRIKRVVDTDASSDDDDDKSPNKGRKNIRKVLKERDLKDETKQAGKLEMERKKRIEERQKKYNHIYDEIEKVKVIEKLVLDFDDDTGKELLCVDKKLVRKLKPHQANGIKFMWDACFETLEQTKKGPGSGCILAHCMGLGKTLQIVALVHTLLTHAEKTKVNTVLVICPLSTVLNWVNEFKIWLKHCSKNSDLEVYEISKYKKNIERAYKLEEWHEGGGVMIIGYDMFRNLSNETGKRIRKKTKEQLLKSLLEPGPDMVVCDEGHLLKNEKTSLSKGVNRIKTLRRIVLTGTPLQNNLKEYYCMVSFVKPNLLGKYTEYLNRFVNPITNGQYTDSTQRDIQIMKRRSHVLHKLLDGCVQRRDYAVLAPFLPPKHEYVVFLQLTPKQIELYKYYMANKSSRLGNDSKKSSMLFADFQSLQRIWTHPLVLRYNSDRYELVQQRKRDLESDSEDSLKDFIHDDSEDSSSAESKSSSSGSSVQSISSETSKKKKNTATRQTRGNAATFKAVEEPEPECTKIENPTEWWTSLVPEEDLNTLELSGKLMFLFALLNSCEAIGDKLLVFSQSLFSLDVIEHFLSLIHNNTDEKSLCGYKGTWKAGFDYFRLDGSTSIENRNAACKTFNNANNLRARLFLISTRAGGLGINLVAANRVVIFDVSWNPSHDIQSIFRVYRFGQIKPCYIYRFIALGTMEEKVYERQVTKLAISKRVIDEQQIDRHYKENDLMELYCFDFDSDEPRPVPLVPKDRLFAELLQKYEDIVFKYHEHESLLENKEEETLNEEERKAAWDEFEAEKKAPVINYNPQARNMGVGGPVTSNMIFGIRSDILLRLLNIKARKDNPLLTDHEVRQIVPLILNQLYTQMEIGDISLYQDLLSLQSELESPMYFNPMSQFNVGGSGGYGNQYGQFPQNLGINPFATNTNAASLLRAQHQQLANYAQQKMLEQQLSQNRRVVVPMETNEVIDLD